MSARGSVCGVHDNLNYSIWNVERRHSEGIQSALRTSRGIPKNDPISGHPSPGSSFLILLHWRARYTWKHIWSIYPSALPITHILKSSRGKRNVTHPKAVKLEFCIKKGVWQMSSRIDWDIGTPGNDGETPLVSSCPGWAQDKRTQLWDSSCTWIPETWNSLDKQVSGKALFYGRGSPQRSCDAFPLEEMRSMCTVMVQGGTEKER